MPSALGLVTFKVAKRKIISLVNYTKKIGSSKTNFATNFKLFSALTCLAGGVITGSKKIILLLVLARSSQTLHNDCFVKILSKKCL